MLETVIAESNQDYLDKISAFNLNDELFEQALKNLHRNTVSANINGRAYKFIRPGDLYPGMWGWDAAFHSIGLAYESFDRAIEELETSALGQTQKGMIPSILFYDADLANKTYFPGPDVWQKQNYNGVHISGISQPPVFGMALSSILSIASEAKTTVNDTYKTRLKNLFDVAFKYQKWWYEERSPLNNGLVVAVHPWETGRDNAIEWDEALSRIKHRSDYKEMPFEIAQRKDNRKENIDPNHRPMDEDYKMFIFLLKNLRNSNYEIKDKNGNYFQDIPFSIYDVGINSILQSSNEALLKICDIYGTPEQKEALEKWSVETSRSIRDLLWDKESSTFQSLDYHTGNKTMASNGSYLPLKTLAPTREHVHAMLKQLQNLVGEGAKPILYNVPSAPPNHPKFEPERYWRGPNWTIVSHLIIEGLMEKAEEYDDIDIAEHGLKMMFENLNLIQNDGEFYEYHNPYTGKGCGECHFGFTSVAYLRLSAHTSAIKNSLIKR